MNTIENYFKDEQRIKQGLNHLTILDPENIKQNMNKNKTQKQLTGDESTTNFDCKQICPRTNLAPR